MNKHEAHEIVSRIVDDYNKIIVDLEHKMTIDKFINSYSDDVIEAIAFLKNEVKNETISKKIGTLTEEERRFIRLVVSFPGSKLNGDSEAWGSDGEPLWGTPEKLNLIKCVGSYKWEPTEELMSYNGFLR